MHVATFNRSPVVTKRPGRQLFQQQEGERSDGCLDPGFEDVAAGKLDVMVAAGIVGHFGGAGQPTDALMFESGYQTHGYHSAHLLERVALGD